jgi:hypothetical protein
MDRYPSALDPTRDSVSRRIAEWAAAAGVSGVLTLVLAAGAVKPIGWWITVGLTVVALAVIVSDEIRLGRLDAMPSGYSSIIGNTLSPRPLRNTSISNPIERWLGTGGGGF